MGRIQKAKSAAPERKTMIYRSNPSISLIDILPAALAKRAKTPMGATITTQFQIVRLEA